MSGLLDQDWRTLIRRIKTRKCTPFLGAGAAAGALPIGADLARDWALTEGYPLEDSDDLSRVAQFLGVQGGDAMAPKELVCEVIEAVEQMPDFGSTANAYGVLARLPMPLVITTNYDNFMCAAFKEHGKDARFEVCRWNSRVKDYAGPLASDRTHQPTVANPVVYHLHGHHQIPESIVLTEDDYLDFLVAVSRDTETPAGERSDLVLPHQIRRALAGSSLMFIGYRLRDWDFRVLHRGVVMSVEDTLRFLSVTVQLPPSDEARDYLNKYFQNIRLKVFWGSAEEFVAELWERWSDEER